IAPVPSGEPSSTTRTSILASCSSVRSMIRAALSRSLYVGIITRARSDTSPALRENPEPGERQRNRQREQREEPALLVWPAPEREPDVRGTLGERHSHQGVLSAPCCHLLAVHSG